MAVKLLVAGAMATSAAGAIGLAAMERGDAASPPPATPSLMEWLVLLRWGHGAMGTSPTETPGETQ
jgi:hypothetical protein